LDAEPVMFLGADVATLESQGKSFAALVGSYDLNFCKYGVRVSEQRNYNENKNSQEIILNMEEMAFLLLKKFEDKMKRFPTRIVFYRDGVDVGQFQDVLDNEIAALKRACAKFNKHPKITMVIVVKRHHVKFYPTQEADKIKSGNPLPGTVVDTGVTSPRHFDFFLNSHQAGIGTAKPTYYWVIYDENNFSSDDMQKMTFNLCHLYASCTKSVSLPAPVYYAHLAAFRGITYNDHLPDLADLNLKYSIFKDFFSNKLYF
jgi:eukaryotic translation initiation factor 2C